MDGARSAPTAIWILSFVICHSAAVAIAAGQIVAGKSPAWAEEAKGAEPRGRVIYLFRDSLWGANPDGSGARPLTKGMPVYAYEVAPDGGRVAFAVGTWRGDRKKRELIESEVWLVHANGGGLRKLVGPSKIHGALRQVGHLRWSPDGQFLAFDVPGGRTGHAGGGALFAVHLPDGAVHAVARDPVSTFEWTADQQIKYRRAVPGEDGETEWLVSPLGTPHPHLASSGPPAATSPSAPAKEVTAAPPPLPPGAVPAPQPPSPPAAPAATPAPAPLPGSGAGPD